MKLQLLTGSVLLKFTLLSFFLLANLVVFGQEKVSTPSPNTMSAGVFGDYPISLESVRTAKNPQSDKDWGFLLFSI
ncbi:hypothetical protein [Pedobacter sp. ASV28]|uniref:hypothetical protein n=1 Tax=Pedobacter sp. ASV28 TaxID=2795123 RepID=UPI0018EBFC15|nr:hypothetical protein [Pedobacter sp. ASV28]